MKRKPNSHDHMRLEELTHKALRRAERLAKTLETDAVPG